MSSLLDASVIVAAGAGRNGTDWPALLVSFGAALIGALVGGGIAYFAAHQGMKHEANLRRKERLREVRAEMVTQLTNPLLRARQGASDNALVDSLLGVERLAYSATSIDRELAEEARARADKLVSAQHDLDQFRQSATLDPQTGRHIGEEPHVDATDRARTDLQNGIQELDDHLRAVLREESARDH
jgi:hypothetical protein